MTDPNGGAGTGNPAPTQPAADAGYEQKLRAGGEFAVSEAKNQQTRADKAESRARELEKQTAAFKDLLDRNKPEDIANAARLMDRMLRDPAAAPVVRNYLATGQLQAAKPQKGSDASDDDDQWKSPEERKIEALEAKIHALESSQAGTVGALGRQAVSRNMESVIGKLGLGEDEIEPLKSKVLGIVSGWATQGDAGREALRSLQDPEKGQAAAQALVFDALGLEGLTNAIRQQVRREMETRQGLATDVPTRGLGAGGESLPEFNSVYEGIQYLKAHPEHDPSRASR